MAAPKAAVKKGRARRLIEAWKYYFPCDRVLAQRMTKSTVNSTVALIFCLIPKVRARLGTEPAMLPLISVMVHPGRRVSGTIQGAIYCMTGLVFGLAYAIFGRFLAQRCLGSSWRYLSELQQYAVHYKRFEAGLAILAVFETLMLFFHGWMRSVSHHYFGIVFPLFLVVHFAFMAPLTESPAVIAESFSVPFYLGIAMSIFWNLTLFPEFGSTFLGNVTIDTFNEVHKAIDASVSFFISIDCPDNDNPYQKPPISLSKLLKMKSAISDKVGNCFLVLDECIYEISYSYVSPAQLKPVIDLLKPLNLYINGLVNACQLDFILLGRQQNREGDIMDIHTDKEIVYADAKKLIKILKRLKAPVYDLHKTLSEGIYLTKIILSYAYDVDFSRVSDTDMFPHADLPRYAHKKDFPKDFDVEGNIVRLMEALVEFDLAFKEEMINLEIDLLNPNDEMFLLSSFLMNFKESANSVITILNNAKEIYVTRKEKESMGWFRGKSFWFTFLSSYQSFKIWLKGSRSRSNLVTENESLKGALNNGQFVAAGESVVRRPSVEENELLSQTMKQHSVPPEDNEHERLPISTMDSSVLSGKMSSKRSKNGLTHNFTKLLISGDKFCRDSKAHFRFGFQVTIALMLASFPMFIPKTRHWYIEYRGTWIGFVCILCLEPSVGGTFWVFFLRAVGVIFGSAWGYLSYVAGVHQTNPYLETVISVFGAAPGFYFLLGTPYVKAAIIQIISVYIVLLAATLPSPIRSSILTSFGKRCLAVGYGGGIALIVQVLFFPTKARDQLNEEIAFVCGCITEMELLYASGLEGESAVKSMTDARYEKFTKISQSAKSALARANAYKGLTRQEPRLKGEYAELENVFTQIIFVQRQIVDRMDNVALLRKQYGSGVIEELNDVVYPYRRQVVGGLTCLMRAMQEAFLTKTPLPQFLPSARIAHRRLINMVGRALHNRYRSQLKQLKPRPVTDKFRDEDDSDIEEELILKSRNERGKARNTLPPHEYALKEKFLSWNASSAATEEVIEYVEELLDLTKILVGINEFKYGFLSRPLYEDWAAEAVTGFDNFVRSAAPTKQRRESAPDIAESSNSGDEASSLGSTVSTAEVEQPVVFNSKYTENNALNLARIASHKAGRHTEGLPEKFKKRTYSIGSYTESLDHMTGLSKRKTLGDADPSCYDEDGDTDDELPLALKKIVSHQARKR